MSWMQLLAVSKSIGTVLDRPSPYKMTQRNLLPRFGGDGLRGEPEGRPRQAGCEVGALKSEAAAEDLFAGLRPEEDGPEPAVELGAARSVGGFERVARAQEARRQRGWWFWRRRSRRVRREGMPLAQEELDFVRVMRNDLMEDDLLVVEMAPGQTKPAWGWRKWWDRWWRKGKA